VGAGALVGAGMGTVRVGAGMAVSGRGEHPPA